MRNGKCPECGSDNIYSNTELRGLSKGQNIIRVDTWRYAAPLDVYVCGNCGYVRTYIVNANALRIITEKWPRVIVSEVRQD